MAFPRKKLKLNYLNTLNFEIQNSPYLFETNSNSETYNFCESGASSDKQNYSICSGQNSLTTSIEMMSGFVPNNMNQSVNSSTENILQSESMVIDETNDIEVRINEWLDNQNIVMVNPEDIIHDFYHKIRSHTIKKMEIELNEYQMNDQSSQSSLTDLEYENLDYSHSKPTRNQRKILSLKQPKQVDSRIRERLVDQSNQNMQIISSLLKRRQNDNQFSITGITTNRYQY